MKYQESNMGTRAEFADYVKRVIPELFGGKLVVEGQNVKLPTDCDLDYKVKYDASEEGGSLTLKVSWDYLREADEVEIDVD